MEVRSMSVCVVECSECGVNVSVVCGRVCDKYLCAWCGNCVVLLKAYF